MFSWLLVIGVTVGCLYWLVSAVLAIRVIRAVPLLERLRPVEPAAWPKVSVIIPACNEAGTVEAAMVSRLSEDYPNLEFVLISDRSTDRTGVIIDSIAARDPRVKAVHITTLPEGWLGKVHAMHRGTQIATGQWLLFTDADVHVAPGTIRRAIAYAEQRGLDHLAAFPAIESAGFWLDVVLAGFLRLFCLGIRIWAVENPASKASIGIGAFNLVRRVAFDRTEGFPWLKLEVGDDVALGMLLKQSGGRSSVVNARRDLRVRWYGSIRQMWIGSQRGGFTVLSRFSFARAVLTGAGLLGLELMPFVALLAIGHPAVQVVGAFVAFMAIATAATMSRWAGAPVVPALLLPVASMILSAMIVSAGYLGWRRGGIIWRGTLYRTQVLRAGARVRFP